jgi:hypothetical protein
VTWAYTFFHLDQNDMPPPCQDSQCAPKRATYRLVAEDGDKSGVRNYCTNCAAKSAARLSLPFPPVESKRTIVGGYDTAGWEPVMPNITKFDGHKSKIIIPTNSRRSLGQG